MFIRIKNNYRLFQIRSQVKVTIRWNEPLQANGQIESYLLKINCSISEKACQENIILPAREREFIFKEDPKENQVLPIFTGELENEIAIPHRQWAVLY